MAVPMFWVNGEPATSVPADDRGLLLADGAFETLWCDRGTVCCAALHEERLAAGLSVLSFPDPDASAALALRTSQAALSVRGVSSGVVRVTVTRGSGPRGYRPPEAATPRVITAFYPSEVAPFRPMRVGWSGIRWSRQPQFGANKLLSRAEQVVAAQEAAEQGWDEVLMCDDGGAVISGSSANLLIRFGSELLTPKLDGVGIRGTRLRAVKDWLAVKQGLTVREVTLTPEDLGDADELLLCNTVRGVQAIASLGPHRWDEYDAGEALHQSLLEFQVGFQ